MGVLQEGRVVFELKTTERLSKLRMGNVFISFRIW